MWHSLPLFCSNVDLAFLSLFARQTPGRFSHLQMLADLTLIPSVFGSPIQCSFVIVPISLTSVLLRWCIAGIFFSVKTLFRFTRYGRGAFHEIPLLVPRLHGLAALLYTVFFLHWHVMTASRLHALLLRFSLLICSFQSFMLFPLC